MKTYKNFIFDLYATLVDIHTDQTKPSLWQYMSMVYSRYGAAYAWDEMQYEYFHLVKKGLNAKTCVILDFGHSPPCLHP